MEKNITTAFGFYWILPDKVSIEEFKLKYESTSDYYTDVCLKIGEMEYKMTYDQLIYRLTNNTMTEGDENEVQTTAEEIAEATLPAVESDTVQTSSEAE